MLFRSKVLPHAPVWRNTAIVAYEIQHRRSAYILNWPTTRRGFLFLKSKWVLTCFSCPFNDPDGFGGARPALRAKGEDQKFGKGTLLVLRLCGYCNPLKSHKTAKGNFGKAWRKQAEIWKACKKSLEVRRRRRWSAVRHARGATRNGLAFVGQAANFCSARFTYLKGALGEVSRSVRPRQKNRCQDDCAAGHL